MDSPPQALLDRRSEPHARAVLDDWHHERGLTPPLRLGLTLQLAAADAAADDADAADADAADAADADAAADDADAALKQFNKLTKGQDMKEGLVLVQVPGSYYGRAVTRAGWLKRVSGDEFELHGPVTVWRTGQRNMAGLDVLASKGPRKDYRTSPPGEAVEYVHRLLIRRCLPCDSTKWEKECPRPKGWEASE